MPIELFSFSRYQDTEEVIFKNQETFGLWTRPDFLVRQLTNEEIGVYLVTDDVAYAPHIIAQAIYGTQDLEWVIIAYNRPDSENVLNWPKAGTVIKYPLPNIVLPVLV